MKSMHTHQSVSAPRHPRGRRRWLYAAIALVLLAVGLQVGMAIRHYNENAAYVTLLDRAKYGGGMRTTHSTGRVHDAIAVVAETRIGPLPTIGDWLQEAWWLLGEPREIKIAGPGVPLEEALAYIADSAHMEEVGLFTRGVVGDELRYLATCNRLNALHLSSNQLSRGALTHIAACEHLTRLDLTRSAGVDDKSIAPLKSLTRLERLSLASTAISDAGLAELKGLRPEFLDLDNTNLSDESVPVLIRMAPKHLRLNGTRFSADGIAQLR